MQKNNRKIEVSNRNGYSCSLQLTVQQIEYLVERRELYITRILLL